MELSLSLLILYFSVQIMSQALCSSVRLGTDHKYLNVKYQILHLYKTPPFLCFNLVVISDTSK